MKHTFTVKEIHPRSPHVRPLVHMLYALQPAPNLFNLAPDCSLYAGWMGNRPVAVIAVDWSDFDTLHQIRLTDAAFQHPIMLRGLIDRVLHQLQPRLQHQTTVTLNLKCDETVTPALFAAIGFEYQLKEVVYELPLARFKKKTFAQWQLTLERPDTYDAWLLARNEHAHLLPGGLALSSKFIDAFHKKQGLVYSLTYDGIVQCMLRGRFEFSRFHILELAVIGDSSMTQEAISYLQQLFCVKFKFKKNVLITTTSLQKSLQDVLLNQEATPISESTYILLKDMMPHHSLV